MVYQMMSSTVRIWNGFGFGAVQEIDFKIYVYLYVYIYKYIHMYIFIYVHIYAYEVRAM